MHNVNISGTVLNENNVPPPRASLFSYPRCQTGSAKSMDRRRNRICSEGLGEKKKENTDQLEERIKEEDKRQSSSCKVRSNRTSESRTDSSAKSTWVQIFLQAKMRPSPAHTAEPPLAAWAWSHRLQRSVLHKHLGWSVVGGRVRIGFGYPEVDD